MEGDVEQVAILAHGKFPDRAKTAVGILRYADSEVVAVLDRDKAGSHVRDFVPGVQDAPIVADMDDVPDCDALVIGIAPIGGGFEESWRSDVRTALQRGCDVHAGLHYFLEEDEEFVELAEEHDCHIWDVRKPPDDLTVAEGTARDVDAEVVLTVGSDCSVGKMTTTMELAQGARARGVDAAVVPTGQTGIMIEGWGIPIDRTISDFTNGAVERMVTEAAEDHDVLFVEGQGAIHHPAYSAVTCGILHGAAPDALVLCHEAGREQIHGYEEYNIPPLPDIVERYETMAAAVQDAPVAAGALNTRGLGATEAATAVEEYGAEIGAPAVDPVRYGVEEVLDELL